MTLLTPEGNPYCSPSETPENAESSPLQLPIRGVVWVDEALLKKAIRYWIWRKGYVGQQQFRLGITEQVFRRTNEHSELAWRLESMSGVGRYPELLLVEITPNSFRAIRRHLTSASIPLRP